MKRKRGTMKQRTWQTTEEYEAAKRETTEWKRKHKGVAIWFLDQTYRRASGGGSRMKRVMLVVLGLGFLANCTAQQPSISAIQHDTIAVQSSVQSFLSAQEEARRLKMVDDEARRGWQTRINEALREWIRNQDPA